MEDNKNAYSEVIEILKLIEDEKKLEALPMEMLELLKSKANPEYKPVINKEIPLDEQNLQLETFAILNWITQKYWNENLKQEDDESIKATDPIEEKTVGNTLTDVDSTDIIQNTEEIENTENRATILPVLLNNLKWYEKIKIKIIELFNKIFKKRNSNETQEGNSL